MEKDYSKQYIVVELPLETKNGFVKHAQIPENFDLSTKYDIEINNPPISIQYQSDKIILIYEGYPFKDDRSPLGFTKG